MFHRPPRTCQVQLVVLLLPIQVLKESVRYSQRPFIHHGMFPSRFLAVLLTTRRSIHTHVTVYGGGLAGLATTFHLLQEGVSVDIVDPCAVGTGGASAVAGGYVDIYIYICILYA